MDELLSSIYQLLDAHYLNVVKVNFTLSQYQSVWSRSWTGPGEVRSYDFEAMKHHMIKSLHPDDVQRVSKYFDISLIHQIIDSNGKVIIKYRHRYQSSFIWVEVEILPANDYSPNNLSTVLFYKNIDAEYAREFNRTQQLEQLATRDALTGLNNRYAFEQYIANYASAPTGVMYLDLNQLKEINDTIGHEAGDNYIRYFCSLLIQVFRQEDCYRIGGDEFVVIVANIDKDKFMSKVKTFSEFNTMSDCAYPLSAIGTFWSDNSIEGILNMINMAESQMYQDKQMAHQLINN